MSSKATITNLDTNKIVHCTFNPKEYTFSKQNKWEEKPADKKNTAHLKYSGGAPANLKLQLLFDTYEAHGEGPGQNAAGDDVRKYTNELWKMMLIDKGKTEPPRVRFEWGDLWSFEAVIESISQKFTLFDATGKPLRAILDISFKQLRDEGQFPKQNPTSGGNPDLRVRTVREGENLLTIAYEELGDPANWRHLADSNQVDDPLRLRPGQSILITPLPTLL